MSQIDHTSTLVLVYLSLVNLLIFKGMMMIFFVTIWQL